MLALLRKVSPNLKAFLDMIAWSEGTAGVGDDGYNVLVGSTPTHPLIFFGYNDHPRCYNKKLNSTAAGRYQLLSHWYDAYKKMLNLKDFSPASQDAIATQQIRERGALDLIELGDIQPAIKRCSNIWASLPGNNYDQHHQVWEDLKKRYVADGGVIKEPQTGSPPVG